MRMTLYFVPNVDGKYNRGNSMKCSECGTENLSNSKFCKTCGAKLESVEIEKVKKELGPRIEKLEQRTFRSGKIYLGEAIGIMTSGFIIFMIGLSLVLLSYIETQNAFSQARSAIDHAVIGGWLELIGFMIFAIGSIFGLHVLAKNIERILEG